jgi:Cu/Ag efflux protein CusF
MRLCRSFALGVCLAAGAVIAPCCSRNETPATATPSAPEAVYTVRGRIVSLPDVSKPGSSLQIQHEPIDNFVRQDGKLGMDSMTMPFPLAKGVSVDGFAAGDVVEVTFEVRWKSQPRFQTTKILKLPAGTDVHVGKAKGG